MAKTFYCDNCGKPVSLKADKCQHCGAIFDAVKCPSCSFTGKADLFANGCPSCGFLGSEEALPRSVLTAKGEESLINPNVEDGGSPLSPAAKKTRPEMSVSKKSQPKKKKREFPGWVYVVTAFILVAVIIILLYFGL